MSTKRNLSPVKSPTVMLFIKAYLWLAVLLLTIILSLSPTSAMAAEAGLLGIGGANSEESERTPIADSFGRDTPRHTVQGFISALGENDYLLASNYLTLSKSDNPTIAVRQLKQALDAGGRFLPDLQLSNSPEGYLADQLQPNQEKVGTINIDDKSVPIILERVVSEKGEQYWQFATDTLTSIPEVLENTEPTLISKYTFESLEGDKLFGYQLTDLIAAIILTVGSFLLTYIVVWLWYHLLHIVYPRVRGEPLPLPDKIILPLSVVIMALILSEIMVYAGVSVALREPINRFTEIASWLAVTWLLLRIVDVLFTRAVNLSYKKNHIERVSILGLLSKVVKALLLIFAVIVIFGNLGFDLTTGIAALGVGGLALALGAQKTIENLVGSVVVVADSPVRIGDYCQFGEQAGTVIDIGIRSSRVRTLNRTVVTVPNGDFSSMQIENFTSRDMFHFLHNLYIKRNADIDVVFKLVKDLDSFLNDHELTNQEWNQANILELRQDCYIIQLRAYVNAFDIIEFYPKQDTLLVDILNLVKQYKVEHALPTQQLIVDQGELEQHSDTNEHDDRSTPNQASNNTEVQNDEQDTDTQNLNAELRVAENLEKTKQSDKQSTTALKKSSILDKPKKNFGLRLAKRKFQQFKRKDKRISLSIWSQPWR